MGISTTIALFVHDNLVYSPNPMASASPSWSEDQSRDITTAKTSSHQTPALEVSKSSGFMAGYNEDMARDRQRRESASSISSNESADIALLSTSPSSLSTSPLATALAFESDSDVDTVADIVKDANDEEQEAKFKSEKENLHDSVPSDTSTQSESRRIGQDDDNKDSNNSSIIWLRPDCLVRSPALCSLPLATIDYYTLAQRSRCKMNASSVPEAIVLTKPTSSTSRSSSVSSLTFNPCSFWSKKESGYRGGLRRSTKPEQDKNFLTIPIPVRRSRKNKKKKQKEEEKEEKKKQRRSRRKRIGQELEALLISMEAASLAMMASQNTSIELDAQTASTSTPEIEPESESKSNAQKSTDPPLTSTSESRSNFVGIDAKSAPESLIFTLPMPNASHSASPSSSEVETAAAPPPPTATSISRTHPLRPKRTTQKPNNLLHQTTQPTCPSPISPQRDADALFSTTTTTPAAGTYRSDRETLRHKDKAMRKATKSFRRKITGHSLQTLLSRYVVRPTRDAGRSARAKCVPEVALRVRDTSLAECVSPRHKSKKQKKNKKNVVMEGWLAPSGPVLVATRRLHQMQLVEQNEQPCRYCYDADMEDGEDLEVERRSVLDRVCKTLCVACML